MCMLFSQKPSRLNFITDLLIFTYCLFAEIRHAFFFFRCSLPMFKLKQSFFIVVILPVISDEVMFFRVKTMRSVLTTQQTGWAHLLLAWSRTRPLTQASEDSSNTFRAIMTQVSLHVPVDDKKLIFSYLLHLASISLCQPCACDITQQIYNEK